MRKIIVGSRRSKLAITQTKWVIEQLKALEPGTEFEIKEIVTKGDQIQNIKLSKVGGKGLFVKEIEQAMIDGEIDMAVHSMKDMPAELPPGLIIGSIPEREDPRDALISKNKETLAELPAGSIIGTSSLRRGAQILAVRPDLKVEWIRGNIDTRLKKLETENFDAIILAAAGLSRMGWSKDVVSEFLSPEDCLPAIGQGALSIECRETDTELRELLDRFSDQETALTVTAERTFLHKMEGGCQVPIAGYATQIEDGVSLTALVASPDGKKVYKEVIRGNDPIEVGLKAAEILTEQGAKALIDQVKIEQEGQ
ncbi:hydroxymethylbilane synthase [Jeotgalibacillus sp. JSM ZJ347]|uniref:hydroxymethylbilane synthase n=1 Tax=Jeotgalibacillus sp. JSM ZJ347 TaxID=3342117 RepID=UPI0035A8C1A2